jgi:hypothetical protein
MLEKKISLKNYLEPIDLDQFQNGIEEINLETELFDNSPFTKNELIKYLQSEEFLSIIDSPLKSELLLKKESQKEIFSIDSIDLKKLLNNLPLNIKEEEIELEKRRRYQAYKYLDYYLSKYSYFDFFAYDTFRLAKISKYLTQIYEKELVSSDFLFLSFLNSTFLSGKLLKKFGFEEKFVSQFSSKLKINFLDKPFLRTFLSEELLVFLRQVQQKLENNFFEKQANSSTLLPIVVRNYQQKIVNNFEMVKTSLSNFFLDQKEEIFLNQDIPYSDEVHQIFEKSTQNALNRFKTPLITPEVLLITLMENRTSSVGEKIEKILIHETNWYIFRYKLLKRLYYQEINVRTQVPRNQQFFAYLLKTEISEQYFERFIKKKVLAKVVALFRNILIAEIVSNNFFDDFEEETLFSISIGSKRHYSS